MSSSSQARVPFSSAVQTGPVTTAKTREVRYDKGEDVLQAIFNGNNRVMSRDGDSLANRLALGYAMRTIRADNLFTGNGRSEANQSHVTGALGDSVVQGAKLVLARFGDSSATRREINFALRSYEEGMSKRDDALPTDTAEFYDKADDDSQFGDATSSGQLPGWNPPPMPDGVYEKACEALGHSQNQS